MTPLWFARSRANPAAMIGNHSARLHHVDRAGRGWAVLISQPAPAHPPIDEPAELRPSLGSLIVELTEQLIEAGAQLPDQLAAPTPNQQNNCL